MTGIVPKRIGGYFSPGCLIHGPRTQSGSIDAVTQIAILFRNGFDGHTGMTARTILFFLSRFVAADTAAGGIGHMHGLGQLHLATIWKSGLRVAVSTFFQGFMVAGTARLIGGFMHRMLKRHRVHLLGGQLGIGHGLCHPTRQKGKFRLIAFHARNGCKGLYGLLGRATMAAGTFDRTGFFILGRQILMTIDTGIVDAVRIAEADSVLVSL
jgi:hypothetical protein